MFKQLSRSGTLIAAMHHAALKALAAAPNGQLKVGPLMQAIESTVPPEAWVRTVWRQVIFYAAQLQKLFNWVESAPTHPPHVLVSAKVLLQSRRAKGGFSFCVLALYG